ncbi:hypothetical protein GCM10027614_81370 [Micromonospora vulcania]
MVRECVAERRQGAEEHAMDRPVRVAIVGAGPAGIYAADILTKAAEAATVDIFDRLPTPYGLIRYGVAPDHPRIKEIVTALHQVLDNPGSGSSATSTTAWT